VPFSEGATPCDLECAYECEEQDGSKERDREGVQVKRIGEAAAKSGTGSTCASAEEAGQTGESLETARQCGERWIQAFEKRQGKDQSGDGNDSKTNRTLARRQGQHA